MTEGNISAVTGQAKSRKTFTISAIAGAALSGNHLNFTAAINGINVVLFDTEQSPYHARRTTDRINKMAGTTCHDRFTAWGLRPLTPDQRLATVEEYIKGITAPTLLIIDGIKDLGFDFNDLHEATLLIGHLLRWTYEKPLHIVSILHNNKGDNTARGHLGAELINKAETTLQIDRDTKQRDISTVTPKFTRDIDFEPFSFTINENGLPVLTDPQEGTQSRKQAEISENFTMLLSGMLTLQYSELVKRYSELAGVSEPTAKRHISHARKGNLLKVNGGGYYSLFRVNDDQITTYPDAPF
jgi:hypothetical protein